MFKLFRKEHEVFPEALIASNWWASKLLEPTVKYYNGSLCYSVQKKSIPSLESVALFKKNLTTFINNCMEHYSDEFPYNLCITSSDNELINIALDANIDNFETHFGNGALMFIDFDDISVKEAGRKRIKIRK